ncbi:hypothetical protein KZZ52_33185 [Dactylosporangium sp. AC04546]|uniref:hypothetical protein n=1 Tax=Dactylosporangium sp. AC04546 TaxID=2862460 RepID=UPI001EDDF65E|nr:hypothetical protein [Dactylosporangium sp. AC04546]WVK78837.1 hypothetical protein KZZ52_33185 [Dactylosporangium sp. AC04546]
MSFSWSCPYAVGGCLTLLTVAVLAGSFVPADNGAARAVAMAVTAGCCTALVAHRWTALALTALAVVLTAALVPFAEGVVPALITAAFPVALGALLGRGQRWMRTR